MSEVVHAFKGFSPDLTCREFQYAEGRTYTHDGPVEVCDSGFHAVTTPLDVFNYYPPASSVYHRVEIVGPTDQREGDSKVAARQIKIGARLSLAGLIEAQVEWVTSRAKPTPGATSKKANAAVKTEADNGAASASGFSGAATASGNGGAATASGYGGAASASGYGGAASASGAGGAASASGAGGAASASGYGGAASASGYGGAASASGYGGAASASGYGGAASASGTAGAATASGDQSIATVTGRHGRARGAVGSWLVLTEREPSWNIREVRAVRVDGEQIRPDVFYTLRDGEVVES